MGSAHITVFKNSFRGSSNRIAGGGKRRGWLEDVIRDRGGGLPKVLARGWEWPEAREVINVSLEIGQR